MYHYVYRITNINEDKHYYGARTSKIHSKKDIGIYYFSSSSNNEFINEQKENKNNFKYKVIKIFSSREKAIELEVFLHNKFNVGVNNKFYNKVKQSSKKFDTTGIKQKESQISLKRNKIIVKNELGETFQIDANDERYLSGELIPINKNKVVVKDCKGNILRVDKDDERYLSGELTHINKGRVWNKNQKESLSDIVTAKNIFDGKVYKISKETFENDLKYVGTTNLYFWEDELGNLFRKSDLVKRGINNPQSKKWKLKKVSLNKAKIKIKRKTLWD